MFEFLFALCFIIVWLFVLSLFIFLCIKYDLRAVDHTLVYLGRKGNYLSFAVPYKDEFYGFYSIYFNKHKSLNCKPFDFVSVSVSFSPFTANGVKLDFIQVLDPLYIKSLDKVEN